MGLMVGLSRTLSLLGVVMSNAAAPEKNAGTFLSIMHWIGVVIVALGGFMIQLALYLLTIFDTNKKLPGRFYRWMGVAATRVSPAWSFRIDGKVGDYRPSNTVVVSNHQSQADPFLISNLPWEMKWLGKKVLFNIPFVGWSMSLAGDIPIDRGNRDSAKASMEMCSKYLQSGMPVMIFPEGTRSKDGQLLPFKNGAFRLAIENGSDILPLAVAGTVSALPKGSWKVGMAKARVRMGEPISTKGMTLDDLDRLSEMTREAIEALRADVSEAVNALR